jgi:hypothetical protein
MTNSKSFRRRSWQLFFRKGDEYCEIVEERRFSAA